MITSGGRSWAPAMINVFVKGMLYIVSQCTVDASITTTDTSQCRSALCTQVMLMVSRFSPLCATPHPLFIGMCELFRISHTYGRERGPMHTPVLAMSAECCASS